MTTSSPIAVLALDTSSEFCSVALALAPCSDTATALRFFSRHEALGPQSSQRILPAVQEILQEAGLLLSSCTVLAFGSGPGAFTGLRTATAVVQGLGFGLGMPVIPVCTLMACAQAARAKDGAIERVLATIDARMDEVYWGLFEWQPEQKIWRVVVPPSLNKPEDIPVPQAPFALVGRAVEIFGARLPAYAACNKMDTSASVHAVDIATLALQFWHMGQYVQADQALPVYVRNEVVQR